MYCNILKDEIFNNILRKLVIIPLLKTKKRFYDTYIIFLMVVFLSLGASKEVAFNPVSSSFQ